jgi:nucleoside-diphosphate-sugar epimerase
MRYFVTGATGFIGGRVARLLVEEGHEVVALVRSPDKAKDLAALGVQLSPGDITDKESVKRGLKGADGLFHMAAWYKVGVKDKSIAEKINVEGTRNVLEAMKELGVSRGVYTSTLAVNSDTKGQLVDEGYHFDGKSFLSEYDRTKWLAHYQVADPLINAGLPLIIVQPGVNYGPGDTSSVRDVFIQYLQGKLPMVPKETAYCWAHVDDTARGHLRAMEKGKPGQSYIIAGPAHTLVEAFEMAERITGVKAPRMHPAPCTMSFLSSLMGMVEKVVPVPDNMTAESLRVMAGVTYIGSSARAERELGFQARPLSDGLKETLTHEMGLLRN